MPWRGTSPEAVLVSPMTAAAQLASLGGSTRYGDHRTQAVISA
jgi:hypothetical protein